MNNRITFLHFLYSKTKLGEIVSARVSNMKYDMSRIIGSGKDERRQILEAIYEQNVKSIPKELHKKKKSSFSMNIF